MLHGSYYIEQTAGFKKYGGSKLIENCMSETPSQYICWIVQNNYNNCLSTIHPCQKRRWQSYLGKRHASNKLVIILLNGIWDNAIPCKRSMFCYELLQWIWCTGFRIVWPADFNHQLAVTSHHLLHCQFKQNTFRPCGWPGTDAVNTAHAEKVSSTWNLKLCKAGSMSPCKDISGQGSTSWNDNVAKQMHPLIIGLCILATVRQKPSMHWQRRLWVEVLLEEAVQRTQLHVLERRN